MKIKKARDREWCEPNSVFPGKMGRSLAKAALKSREE